MSTIVALIGPIEYWWDTAEEPNRYEGDQSRNYRLHRDELGKFLTEHGFLCYRPHEAFKGPWDERAQVLNDVMVQIADVIVCMRPEGIPGRGTDHELDLARSSGKPVVEAPPGKDYKVVLGELIARSLGANDEGVLDFNAW